MDPLVEWLNDAEIAPLILALEEGHTFKGGLSLAAYKEQESLFKELVERRKGDIPIPIPFNEIIELTNEQNTQVKQAINKSIGLIVGGPGTGKTFTAAKLVEALIQANTTRFEMVFTAPTGKAAQRLKENFKGSEVQAMTLHRLLGREEVILPYDLIIVDEASMIDLKMMLMLLKSLKKGSRLLLIGDVNQLPPVEAGAPFQSLVSHFQVTPLKTCLRSDLFELNHLSDLVLKGKSDEAIDFLSDPQREAISLKSLSIPTVAPILTPLKKGRYGVEGLNRQFVKRGRVPIIILENNESLNLFNGDFGYLEQDVAVINNIKYPANILPRFDYAFSLSIHKSQGSEFEEVHLLVPEGAERFGRKLLYTGITRAKKKLTIYSNIELLKKVIETASHREVGLF
jgi:exodeoxyribonuclease V alpha subunit